MNRRLDRLERQINKAKDKIMVSDASIKTATIEVKVIKINNRQMTLAVFRQLASERIIDRHTGELVDGILWGRVNYHDEVCRASNVHHIHVIWQKGNELRRATAYKWGWGGDYSEWPISAMTQEEKNHVGDMWKLSFAQLEQLDQLFIAV